LIRLAAFVKKNSLLLMVWQYGTWSEGKVVPVLKHYTMEGVWGVDVWIHIFLTSALVGGEWWAPRRSRFTSREKNPRYPLYRRLSGPQSRSAGHGEVKILASPGLKLRLLPPARSQSLYRLSYPGSLVHEVWVY
jgi:hypothetical protein